MIMVDFVFWLLQASTRRTDDMQVYELQQKIQDLQEKLESVGITEVILY